MYFGRMHRDGDRFFAQVLSLNSGSSGSLGEAAAMAPICGWACFLTAKKWNLPEFLARQDVPKIKQGCIFAKRINQMLSRS